MSLSQNILKILKQTINKKKVALHEPIFFKNDTKYLLKCIETKMVSSIGSYVTKFEKMLTEFTGAKYAIAVVNGTSAIHLALIVNGIKKNDEVILSALNFVATASAIVNAEAHPHFVDSNEKNLGVNVTSLRKYLEKITFLKNNECYNKINGKRIHSIIATHIFGHPCDLKDLKQLSKDFNLKLIEDAAEALGSYYKGKHVGTTSLMGILSFNGNKTISTGGGGAILTNNKSLAIKAKHLSTTAKIDHPWEFYHDDLGFNYRMPNLNAALGCSQMENISFILSNKRKLYEKYRKAFLGLDGVNLMSEPKNSKSNYWLQTLIFDKSLISERNKFLEISNNYGIQTRPVWKLISNMKPYKNFSKSPLPISLSLEKRLVNIPSNFII